MQTPIPLGNLLGVVHHLPEVCPTGPAGVYKTLCFLSQLPLRSSEHMLAVWPVCRAMTLAQHPALNDLSLPLKQITEGRWDYIWAWLDEAEQRLGAQLPVAPALDADWYRAGWNSVPRAVNTQGLVVKIDFEDAEIVFL